MTDVVRLEGVGVSRSGTEILDDVSLVVDEGQRWVIVAGVAVSNIAADGAAVAHLWVGNQFGRFA